MNTQCIKKATLCCALVWICMPVSVATAARPNIVVFLADDQGWGDLRANGNTNLATPNVDSLARDGAVLENFYVCQVCAPTRAEFLTGRYYPRTGVSGVSRGQGRLNYDETTIANCLRSAGYATGCFGKWHNGTQPPYHPNNRGFDEFYGFTSGHWGHYFSPPLDHNGRRVRGQGFVIDDFTNKALKFIEEHQQQPFFCYVPYNTPHSPMMVPDRHYAKFAGKEPALAHRDPDREDVMMTRAALALCENIDWNVGRILAKLDSLKLSDNTIVIYFSDNGPNSYRWNGGMKGRKGSLDEGGLRSPCFVRWPVKIKAGLRIPQICGAIDLLPTLLQLTETKTPNNENRQPIDGKSLVPLLFSQAESWPSRLLFSIKGKQVSVRDDEFRLDPTGKLFHIASDRGQRVDVADQHQEVAQRLHRQAQRHAAEMQACFVANADRPFTVGFGINTTLPARDGVPHGTIQRSSKAPNNSFFKHWTRADDYITWDVDVKAAGEYEVVLYYTCADGDQGVTLKLSQVNGDATQAIVAEVFDPPLYDKPKERVTKSHYFVKDFNSLSLGTLNLKRGRGQLKLEALDLKGPRAIDVHSIDIRVR